MAPQTGLILASQVLSALVAFITIPYIALGLGAERYGLYALLFLVLGYSTALDFGLSFALVKHVAEHDSETGRAEIDSFVNNVTAVYGVIALVSVAALVGGRDWIAGSVLEVPSSNVAVVRDAILLLACAVPFSSASTVFNALFRGLLRFDYLSLFSVLNVSVYSIGAALLIIRGGSLRAVIGWYAVVTAVSAVAQWAVLRRLLPGFHPVPRMDRPRLKRLFGFGSFMAIDQLGSIALLQLDRLVIARVMSIPMAAYYAIPFTVSQRLNMLGAAAATVGFPHSSASIARGELADFRDQHLQSARVVTWLTLAPTLAVIVLADQILYHWMSPEFAAHGATPLRILAFGRLWISVASLDAVSIEGSGRPWVTALFMGITGIMNVVGLMALTPVWGLGGAAASVTFSLLALAALDVWYCGRFVTGSPLGLWGRSTLLPAIKTSIVSVPVAMLLRHVVSGLPSLIIVMLVATGFSVVLGYWLFLSTHERRWVKAAAARLWSSTSIGGALSEYVMLGMRGPGGFRGSVPRM